MTTFHLMIKQPQKKLVLSDEEVLDKDKNPVMSEQNEPVRKVVFARIGNNLKEDRKPVIDPKTEEKIKDPSYCRYYPEVNIFTMVGNVQPTHEPATPEQYFAVLKKLDELGKEYEASVVMTPEEYLKMTKKKK